MKFWDISRTLSNDIAHWPGDTPFQFQLSGKIAEGSAVNLGEVFGRSSEKHLITTEDLRPHSEEIAETLRLLIKTGRWSDSEIFPNQIPVISADVPGWLQKNGVKLLGLDLPSVDEVDSKSLPNHHALARAGIAIIESLDLKNVGAGIYNLVALPLKIAGGDAAPLRAVLWRDC